MVQIKCGFPVLDLVPPFHPIRAVAFLMVFTAVPSSDRSSITEGVTSLMSTISGSKALAL